MSNKDGSSISENTGCADSLALDILGTKPPVLPRLTKEKYSKVFDAITLNVSMPSFWTLKCIPIQKETAMNISRPVSANPLSTADFSEEFYLIEDELC